MRHRWLLLTVLSLTACAKSASERHRDVLRCSERSSDELEIRLCLESQFGWKSAHAEPVARARARELDSIEAWRADSAWAGGAERRRREVRQCSGPELARCLLVQFGWPEERAAAAAESVWTANVASHKRELTACTRQRENVGSCLMLRYKWPTDRALAANDSIQRARMAQ